MRIFVDIDGTLARESVRGVILTYAFMGQFSEERKREALETGDYHVVSGWPEMLALKEKWGATEFRRRYLKCRLIPDNLASQEPIDGALSGVRRLAEFGEICYAT